MDLMIIWCLDVFRALEMTDLNLEGGDHHAGNDRASTPFFPYMQFMWSFFACISTLQRKSVYES